MFCKLDLKQTYLQMELEPCSRKYTTTNTPQGAFQYNRLPFRGACSPALFQWFMDIFRDLPWVKVYDLLVSAESESELWQRTEQVLKQLEDSSFVS